jgi:hypothetical protein
MQVDAKIFNLTSILHQRKVSYTHTPPTDFWSGEIIFGLQTISISYDQSGIAIWDGLKLIDENANELEAEAIADFVTSHVLA